MISLSLETQPPPISRWEKEAKKRNENIPQIIFSVKNNKNSNKSATPKKNIEKNIRDTNIFGAHKEDYSNIEANILDTSRTDVSGKTRFSDKDITNSASISENFIYMPLKDATNISDKKFEGFYTLNSNYSFEVSNKSEEQIEKKERKYQKYHENEEKEIPYVLGVLEEEKKPVDEIRDNALKWDPAEYN